MKNPLEALVPDLDPDASKVTNFPALVFLCGGPLVTKEGPDPSLRALFYQCVEESYPELFGQLHLAEEANQWSSQATHYDNLLSLENDLASISAVILVFVESAGSIAELGAFVQSPRLLDKLGAVLEWHHQWDNSFIQNGPVSLLRGHDRDSVHFCPWLTPEDEKGKRHLDRDAASESIDMILRWLCRRVAGLPKTEAFRKNDTGHKLLLIADCIDLGTIALKKEIASFMTALGVKCETKELDRYLFLLKQLHFIDATEYGNNTYYVAGPEGRVYVHYAYKQGGKPWDRGQVTSELSADLFKMDSDRKNAWKRYQEIGIIHG